MKVYIVLEYRHGSFSEVLGVFTSLQSAQELKEKNWNCWANEERKIVEKTIDK